MHAGVRYPVNWPADSASWLTPPGMIGAWVAIIDSGVVGHIALTAADLPDAARVERLFADPSTPGRGIGRALLDAAQVEATRRNLRLGLEVADNCVAAIALYRRLGWREVGRAPIAWGGDVAASVIEFEP